MVKPSTYAAVDTLIARYPALEGCGTDIRAAITALCECYRAGGKLIVCGNGGSASDAEHIVGELMKGFLLPRHLDETMLDKLHAVCDAKDPRAVDYFMQNLQGALPAISLPSQLAISTAFSNDQAPDLTFAQQVLGLGKEGDILLGITTSGNSKNVIYAFEIAKALGLTTVALTGTPGGRVAADDLADIVIKAPASETYVIQEYHLPIYHALCIAAEEEFFG
ncbi:MAG: SIS domain-containing protein [Selenomonas artemidis]|uniref:D-sedoheptulose-7-phosphate isomerase n=1 Tax=Selenomonas artemidis TaxID=671224 RepID=UPI001CB2D54F|nr:SIS domain-containing protein [Selenomonas artemidis]MBF1682243.1 SIS domain-containing protein [Selenomonas artemidis]